ncbi:hypothetical protein BGX33_001291, partial [Mortierella sp. NVP41]
IELFSLGSRGVGTLRQGTQEPSYSSGSSPTELASANVRAVMIVDIRPSKVKVSSEARAAKDV